MKRIHLLFMLIAFSLSTFAQVGINTEQPTEYTALHVSERNILTNSTPDSYNGIIIQRYTEEERDNQLTPNMGTNQNSLMIYNTTEDCYNYWNNIDKEWKSLCGSLGKSQFTFDCSSISIIGSYIKGKSLTNSNYINIPVTVTKPGEYNVTITTTNGYSFQGKGTFLNSGTYTIQVTGQGTPIEAQTDNLTINANDVEISCTPVKTITVMSASGQYTLSCGSAIVNGVYKVGTALTTSNTITLPVNVATLGSYTITTNTVDGISFTGSGVFTATGSQNVTLNGTGTPTSTTTKKMTITSDSQGAVSTTCNVDVIVVIPGKRLLTIGNSPNGYGYNFSGTAASNKLITTPANYGALANSVVKYDGWTQIINGGGSPNATQLTNWTTGSDPVDIIVIGFDWGANAAEAQIIANYLAKGGVVLAFVESGTGSQNILRAVFDGSVTTTSVNSAGALYKLPLTNDAILNGPFGDIRGMQWGEDASSTEYALGLPTSGITVYSGDTNISTATPTGNVGRVTGFKHNTLNFIWMGDGGFNSNDGGTSNTICPFYLNSSNFPIPKPNYGNGATAYRMNVYNSIFTANAFAWAIERAEHNGINTK